MAKFMKDKMWKTIADLNAHVQVDTLSRRYTFLDFLAKFGTGLILLAPTV
jgi:hypothetical protein